MYWLPARTRATTMMLCGVMNLATSLDMAGSDSHYQDKIYDYTSLTRSAERERERESERERERETWQQLTKREHDQVLLSSICVGT
jgi:hypothetical protein